MLSLKSLLTLSFVAVAFAAPSGLEARDLQARQNPLSGTHSGDATFFNTGLGACGLTNKNTDLIVAMSATIFDNFPGANGNPNDNPICGQKINVQCEYQGKSVQVTIVDRCAGCATNNIDLSPSAFQDLANESLGRIPVTWELA